MPLKKSVDDIKRALVQFGLEKDILEGNSTRQLVDLYNNCVVPKPQRIPRHNREGKRLRETLKRSFPAEETGDTVKQNDEVTCAKIAKLSIQNSSDDAISDWLNNLTNEDQAKISNENPEKTLTNGHSAEQSPAKRKIACPKMDKHRTEDKLKSENGVESPKKKIVKITFS